MNVLLLFANCALFLSVIKDFLDTNWKWENKLMLNISLFLISLVPTFFNVFVFLTSDLPKCRTLCYNVIKAVCMDYFPIYLSNRCFENNISFFGLKFGKWLFCNKSIGRQGRFNGGKVLLVQPNCISNLRFFENIFDFQIYLNTEEFARVINSENPVEFEDSDCPVGDDTNFFDYETAKLVSRFLSVDQVVQKFCGKYVIKSKSLKSYAVSGTSLILKFEGIYSEVSGILLGWAELGFVDVVDFLTKSDLKVLHNKQKVYDLEMLKFKFILDRSSRLKFVKFNSRESKSVELLSNITLIQYVKIHMIYTHWTQNPETGVILDNKIRINGCYNHQKRNGVPILHTLDPEEVIDNICSNALFYFTFYESQKMYVEGLEVNKTLNEINNKFAESLLGVKNNEILNKLILKNINNIDPEECLAKLKNPLLEFMRLRDLRNKFSFVGNYRGKQLYSDLNYFFKLINYGKFFGVDNKVCVSKFASQECRPHQKLKKDQQLSEMENIIEKSIDTINKLETEKAVTKKAKNLRIIKKNITTENKFLKLAFEDRRVNLKSNLANSYKKILIDGRSSEKENLKLSSEILYNILFTKSTPKMNKDETKKVTKKSETNKATTAKKSENKRKELVKVRTPANLWNKKNEKMFDYLDDKLNVNFYFNRFNVLSNLKDDYKEILVKAVPQHSVRLETIRQKKEVENKKRKDDEEKIRKTEEEKKLRTNLMLEKLKRDDEESKRIRENFPTIEIKGDYPCNKVIYDIVQETKLKEDYQKLFLYLPKLSKNLNSISMTLSYGRKVSQYEVNQMKAIFDEYYEAKKTRKVTSKVIILKDLIEKKLVENNLIDFD